MFDQFKLNKSDSFPVDALDIIRNLFVRLRDEDILYCHWKSNEHLDASAKGLTDLDVLIESNRTADLQKLLADVGFRRFAAPPLRSYPGIEDYLGFDAATGRLIHLHLHYQLTLGERHLKGYRLPWEAQLLQRRKVDPVFGIHVTDPADELLLLLVRAGLKHRFRDRLKGMLPKADRNSSDFHRELDWLRQTVDAAALCNAARDLIGPGLDEAFTGFLTDPKARNADAALAKALRPRLSRFRTYGPVEAQLRAWLREAHWIADAVNRRYLHRPLPLRRVSPRGGTVIVLLGSDGSGKSSLCKTLTTWLGTKLDVMPLYLGSGAGPAAFYRAPLRPIYQLLPSFIRGDDQKAAPGSGKADEGSGREGSRPPVSRFRSIARIPWALALSLEKRGRLRQMVRARNKGMIVVCDRYLQVTFPGFNDGPLLDRWRNHPWSVCRAIAAWEAKPYAEAGHLSPDIVIKLVVTPEIANQRRPEMSIDEIGRRVRATRALMFPPPTTVVEISADLPIDEVAKRAKQIVWEYL